MRITRRKLAVAMLSATAGLAQAPAPPLPRTPDEELAASREQVRLAAEALARFSLPVATEPACSFRA